MNKKTPVKNLKKNAFDLEIFSPKEVFEDEQVAKCINKAIISVLNYLGISKEKSDEITEKCLKLAKGYNNISEYEKEAHDILESEGVVDEIPKKLEGRASLIFEQVKPYIIDGSILDLGCGDGRVAELLAREGHEVKLIDVYKNGNIEKTGLEFKLFDQGQTVPFADDSFDNSIVLTVFHHSSDPLKTLAEAYRTTKDGGRVIVIESVYGVNQEGLSEEVKAGAEDFLVLSKEQQRKLNMFFDHFYNRVVHYSADPKNKVNVPFNFNTPEGWKKVFEDNGFEQEKVEYLGIDQPVVPEFHTLHVLRVKK